MSNKALRAILEHVDIIKIYGSQDVSVQKLCDNSKVCISESLFFARSGSKYNGINFVKDAIQHGAIVIVTECSYDSSFGAVSWIQVKDIKQALFQISSNFYDHPERSMHLIGITGTNGKTTTAYMLQSLLVSQGINCGLISTVEICGRTFKEKAVLTTPSIVALMESLAHLLNDGCDWVVMEVSSHALEQDRVWGLKYDGVIFTNLTQDHLDYHHNMENYFAAKCKLFESYLHSDGWTVINTDDDYGKRLYHLLKEQAFGFGFYPPTNILLSEAQLDAQGGEVLMNLPSHKIKLKLPLLGTHNLYNAAAALLAAWHLRLDIDKALNALGQFQGVMGRMETFAFDGKQIIVDFAHTPDGLEKVLRCLRPLVHTKLWVVFGCGGERDRTKRLLMTQLVADWADKFILTKDNPRCENPEQIFADMLVGLSTDKEYWKIPDRKEAIRYALDHAQETDIVLIAGKGHEQYQDENGVKIPFSDQDEIKKYMQSMLIQCNP